MFQIEDNRIYLTRGDTADINVTLTKLDGSDYEIQEDDTLIFRMKKYATKESSEVLIERTAIVGESGDITITLTPEDTLTFAFGEYRYEVELVTSAGDHYTVIADMEFEVGKELENHEG